MLLEICYNERELNALRNSISNNNNQRKKDKTNGRVYEKLFFEIYYATKMESND